MILLWRVHSREMVMATSDTAEATRAIATYAAIKQLVEKREIVLLASQGTAHLTAQRTQGKSS